MLLSKEQNVMNKWKKLNLIIWMIFILPGCGKSVTSEAAAAATDSLQEMEEWAASEVESPDSESAETLPEPVMENPTLSLIMVGDILLHTPVEEAARQEDGTYNFDAVFENLKEDISEADLAIVNQEVILGGEELGISGYPAFNAPFSVGDALTDAGFDVICHATNHALDKGKRGLLNCIAFWEENGT